MAIKKLILVVDNEVCGHIEFDDSFPKNINILNDFIDNPKIVEVDISTPVQRGWIYNGTNFTDPNVIG